MARRPFDASFSRRPGHGSGPGGGLAPSVSSAPPPPISSLMGDYNNSRGAYQDDEDNYAPQPTRVPISRPYRGGGGEEEYDAHHPPPRPPPQQFVDRVSRGPPGPPPPRQQRDDFDFRPNPGASGGWRQRSPSPRFMPREMERDRGDRVDRGMEMERGRPLRPSDGRSSWTTRGVGGAGSERGDYLDETDFIGSGSRSSTSSSSNNLFEAGFRQQQQQQDFLAMQQQQQRIFANSGGILRNADPVVKVLLQPTGGLMGNMGLNNPFGMLGASPMLVPAFSNASPFGQQQQLIQQSSNPFGSGVGASSSIYGSQTQQALDRSRNNLITASDSRRNDFYRGGGGRRSESERNRSDSASRNDSPRKRNLVLRDPRPDEGVKRPRISAGSSSANKKTTQVKRVDLGDGGGSGKKSSSSHRPSSSSNKDKDKDGNKSKDKSDSEETKALSPEEKEKLKKEKEAADKDRKTEYDDIPGYLLVCKVCQKSMNDGQSFESHLSGRAHQSLMKILEERFAKRVELLMNESKCSEDEIGIEMDRQRRAGAGKGGRAEKKPSNYCKMCDCHYAMNWGAHKVSLGHRVLKEFLHPTCQFCKAHFMHRKDWVLHLLSPAHMKKLQEIKEEQGSSPLLEEQESPYQDELFTIYFDRNRDERTTNAITIKSKDGRESLTEEMKEILKNDRGEIVLPDGEIPLPKEYSNELMVGADAVVSVSGNRCRVCRVYIPEDKSVDNHCSSKEHFNQYVSFLKRVNAHREHKERDRKEAEEKARREEERAKRRAEEKAKSEAARKEKAEAAAAAAAAKKEKEEADGTATDTVKKEGEEGEEGDATNGETKMEVDVKVEQEEEGTSSSPEKKIVAPEVVDLEDDNNDAEGVGGDEEEDQEQVQGEDQDEEMEENEEEDVDDEEEDEEDEEVEGEDAFIPSSQVVDQDNNEGEEEQEDVLGDDSVEIAGSKIAEDNNGEEEETFAQIVAVSSAADTDEQKNGNNQEEELDNAEESNDSVEQIEIVPAAAAAALKTPAGRGRGRGGRGATPASKATPALRNVQAKVDTNIRGGRGGRGGAGARSPRARGGRGAR